MRQVRHSRKRRAGEYDFRIRPAAFIFFDKATGAQRFEVKADAAGRLPSEEAVGLLAMHCLLRGQSPANFRVMVTTQDVLVERLAARAQKLVRACTSSSDSVQLSGRQREVMAGIFRGLGNKEIATKLNVSESTIKFHVSALLHKFHVVGRAALVRKGASPTYADAMSTEDPPTVIVAAQKADHEIGPHGLRPRLLRVASSERRSR